MLGVERKSGSIVCNKVSLMETYKSTLQLMKVENRVKYHIGAFVVSLCSKANESTVQQCIVSKRGVATP